MTSAMEKYVLGVLSEEEIEQFRKELERIQEKHGTVQEPCEFEIEIGEEGSGGGRLISLLANKTMMGAFVLEQIL